MQTLADDSERVRTLRDQLWADLQNHIEGLRLNGPPLESQHRLPGNLNFQLRAIEGETWMAATPNVAFSSGSACSSADAMPSHVLLAMGLSESEARRSVRFGIGRSTTPSEIDSAVNRLTAAHQRLLV
jgi:cysteine desulfurase